MTFRICTGNEYLLILNFSTDEGDAFDEEEEDELEEEVKLPGKVGTKKLRRIQEKAERKAKREVREDG